MKRWVGALAFVALAVTACTGGAEQHPSGGPSSTPQRGGTLRVGLSSLGLSDNLDPTGEYTGGGWGALWPQLRTLVAYRVAPGAAGLQIVPDLATSVPQPSDGGLTYTFTLKSGIRFAPPVNREITSQDVAYAFERINTSSVAAQYGFYYSVIKGITLDASTPQPIEGIETPNDRTIVFHLSQPTGDFVNRLTMPATAPIPPEVGGCFTKPGEYGRDIVASGPYMIQGSESVDVSSCDAISPSSGFVPDTSLTLVRNPNYESTTDSSTERKAYANAIKFSIDTNVSDIFQQLQSGDLDLSWYDSPPAVVLRQYLTDPQLKPELHSIAAGATEYFQMNLTAPPFDDIHVRKAVNYALNREAVLRAWGGSVAGTVATHLIPTNVLGGVQAAQFDLYPSNGSEGDLAAAKAEIQLSRYDSNGDGVCDAAACSKVLMISQNVPPWTDIAPIIEENLKPLGIKIVTRELDFGAAFSAIQNPKSLIPAQIAVSWGYDYPDAYPYYASLLSSQAINATANLNFSMVGLTPDVAKKIGVPYPPQPIPSVDHQIDACERVPAGQDRFTCWANLERTVMSDVVPIAPMVWYNLLSISGSDVVHWESSPQQGQALVNIAVSNGLSP